MNHLNIERVAALEWINYEASQPIVQATPGLDMILADEIILTSSDLFPAPDTTHACRLRATPETIEPLLDRTIDYFKTKNLPSTIFVSPACTPTDLPQRLAQRGFAKNPTDEAWLVGEDLRHVKLPGISSKVVIEPISIHEVLAFVNTFIAAFDLPTEVAAGMADLIVPSVGLPGVYYYLGYVNGQPVSTFSLICHNEVGIIGSAGVLPGKRGQFIISNLAIKALETAQAQGANTILLQTAAGSMVERLLRIYGFKKTFTRTSYSLP